MSTRDKIMPCLWFDTEAKDAADYYVSVFGGRILSVSHYSKKMMKPEGEVLLVEFEIAGRQVQALNGGPQFKFTEAISLSVTCETQAEVDKMWARLVADGGSEVACGWLKDKYGLSWQIVPARMVELMKSTDKEKVERLLQAMMQMVKLDVAKLEAAFAGG